MPNPDSTNQAIDANDRATMTALNDTTLLPERWRVDSVLNLLEVILVADDGLTPTARQDAKTDGNDRATLIGLNDTTGKSECFSCDANGVLRVLPV